MPMCTNAGRRHNLYKFDLITYISPIICMITFYPTPPRVVICVRHQRKKHQLLTDALPSVVSL
nr:MAG TPA: hypothetical protein [Caudoviricetes sp.]